MSSSNKRRNMTLDFNQDVSASKRANASQILTSPDVQMLKLTSPELAAFLSRNPALNTPTPGGGAYVFPKTVTEEQEIYAKGFEEALRELHSKNETQQQRETERPPIVVNLPSVESRDSNVSRPSSEASGSLDSSLDGNYGDLRIKEEPDFKNNDNVEPINMESQERIKLERKRLRNRVAASKCRRRKLERISQLDDKVNLLKGENTDLTNVVKRLKEDVCNLKQEVIKHIQSGCEIMINELPSFAD